MYLKENIFGNFFPDGKMQSQLGSKMDFVDSNYLKNKGYLV